MTTSSRTATRAPEQRRAPSGKKALATRKRILDAAAKLFRANGYTGTRLTDIAEAANTQAGSMYYHFPSRESLVRDVLRAGQQGTIDFVFAKVAQLPDDATSLQRLQLAMTAHLEAILELGDYTAATLRILGQVPHEVRAETVALQREYGEWWGRLFQQAQEDGDLRDDVDLFASRMFILGAMNASADWFHPDQPRGLKVEALEEQFSALFLDGLATSQGRRRRSKKVELATVPLSTESSDDSRGAATTTRILDGAARIFREHGYAGTRLVDVAGAADIQTGSLYYHFDSREDLVTRLLHDAWDLTFGFVRASVDLLPPTAAPVNVLAVGLTAHLATVVKEGNYTSAMLRILGQVPPEVRDTIRPLQRTYLAYWKEQLDKASAAGDIRSDLDLSVVTLVLVGALNWTVEWYDSGRDLSVEDLGRDFTRLVFDGIATRRRKALASTGVEALDLNSN